MGLFIGLGIMLALAGFTVVEIARFGRARRGGDEFPYPRRRLTRRLAIAAIFMGIVALLTFWPHGPAGVQLVLLLALLGAMGVGFVLLLRDLRETSLEVVRYTERMNAETGRELESLLRGDAPPRPPDSPPPGE